MREIVYPAHGWLPPGARVQWERDDQGKDFVSPWEGHLQAPGEGHCVRVASDRGFPLGFGPRYPVVWISSGAFANSMWYMGHNTALVSPGERFSFGHPLARVDQGRPGSIGVFCPFDGGWTELGQAPGGSPGPMASWHWYDPILFRPLVVQIPDQVLRFGFSNIHVYAMSGKLRDCGYLPRPFWTFNHQVHGAVIAFQRHHRLPADGEVGPRTVHILNLASHWCRVHHRKEV